MHEVPAPSSITIYSKFGELSKVGGEVKLLMPLKTVLHNLASFAVDGRKGIHAEKPSAFPLKI